MGVPPTLLKARTGELTPPGMLRCARLKSCSLLVIGFFTKDHTKRKLIFKDVMIIPD
jgi:hypothetical protein